MNRRIFIVEDDTIIQKELKELLIVNAYYVQTQNNFENIIDEIKNYKPHLVLLDINLPNENGFKICSKIRSFSAAPIIFVTSRNTDMDELNSIMLGGDAFITKPYNTPILLAKIHSLINKAYLANHITFIKHNDVKLNLASSIIECQEQTAELTKTELKIMNYLFKYADEICPRADIIEYLWDNRLYIDDNTLSVNITRIRDKLASIGLNDFIKTKHRQGYMI